MIREQSRSSNVVQLMRVGKTFRQRRGKRFRALEDINFTLGAGKIHGLLGRNGAGKSTLVKLVCGLQRPTDGQVLTLGYDPARHRYRLAHQIGVVFGHKSSLWWDLSIADNLAALCSLYRIPADVYAKRRELIVEGLNLGSVLDRPIRQLSLGERVKSEIAGALLHGPRLLVLDEPTIGLDLVSKRHLRRWLSSVAKEDGVAVLLTSHDTSDIAVLCQNVTLIEQGKVAFSGTVNALRAEMADRVVVKLSALERMLEESDLAVLYKAIEWEGCTVEVADDRSCVSLSGPTRFHDDLVKLALALKPAKHGLMLETNSPTLEDAILSRFERTDR